VAPRRSLETVLFTDIVGSTERAVQLGDRAWHQVLDEHNAAVRREIHRFGGREINTTGDGFLAAFPRPALAIRCAWSIHEAVGALDLAIRAGVHMGAVEHHGRDLGGVGVHIGARIAGRAGPGETLVSNAVRESEAGSGFEFEDRGEHDLKGIPGGGRLHAVVSVPEGGWIPWTARWLPASAGPRAVATAAAAPGIAVLPFDVRGGEEQEVWREGMVDALSTSLGGVTGLRAIESRTLMARWREAVPADSSPDVTTVLDVARRAGARYAVTGSLIEAGEDLRIVAEVHDLQTGGSLGTERVEGAADAVLSLVDRLAVGVLRTVGSRAEELGEIDLARVSTTSLPAFRAFLRGEGHRRAGRLELAAEAYREAVAADSTFALAWMGLGEAYVWTAPPRIGEALMPALRFVDLLPEREALLVRAYPESRFGTPEGLELLREATRRFPDSATAWFRLGEYMYHQGPGLFVDPRETRRAFARATDLDTGNSPAYAHFYYHRIDLQMRLSPDSATVHRLNDVRDRLRGRSDTALEVLLGVAFGTDSTRAAALRAIDTLEVDLWFPYTVYLHLSHPRFFPDKARVLRIVRGRSLPDVGDEVARWMYASTLLDRGRLADALVAIEHPKAVDRDWGGRLYLARVSGLPVPDERLDAALPVGPAIDPDRPTTPGQHANREAEVLFSRGAWALDRGRWDEYEATLGRAREVAARGWAEADSVAARYADGVVLGLEGLGAWKSGDLDRAERRLDEARLATNAGGGGVDPVKKILWWGLARLAVETGRGERAARVFRTLARGDEGPGDPLALLELARAQERLGRLEEAQAHYELFALAWEDADPELQPLVREALESAARVEER